MLEAIRSGKKLEWVALGLFMVLYCLVSSQHEPWFDEAQAWQIAKCASISDILFEVPHYEGHPPLWHLILAIPAKLGVPFDIGLKATGFVFSSVAAALVLFKMPYPRIMRLVLPFTYFVFYQYGVIVRPYTLMLIALLLLALALPLRGESPWRFTGLMALLCLTSAYGMLLACGIALCWTWELVREKGISAFLRELVRDQRTLSLIALLGCAVALVLMIVPRADTWVVSAAGENPFLLCFACSLLTFLPECLFTTSSWFNSDMVLLQSVNIPPIDLFALCIGGVLVWAVIVAMSSKRSLKYFVVPYVLYAAFAAKVYFSSHHIGIALLLFLFWLGVLFQDENRFEIGRAMLEKVATSQRDRKLAKGLAVCGCAACAAVSLFWSAAASYADSVDGCSYYDGKDIARYLQETGLEDSLIMAAWYQKDLLTGGMSVSEGGLDDFNPYQVDEPVAINAYMGRNICFNMNGGRDDRGYMQYKLATPEEKQAALAEWKAAGHPDVLIGPANLKLVYGDELSLDDYSIVKAFDTNRLWKDRRENMYTLLFVRNDLLEQYGLMPVDDPKYTAWKGVEITDEMRERFENGESMESILDPYLDAVLGED